MFLTTKRIVLFALGIAGLYVLPILAREKFSPGFGVGFIFYALLLVFLSVAVGALIAVIRYRHRQPKWMTWGAVVIFALWFPSFNTGSLHKLGDHLYFARREAALRDLAARIERYGTIQSMNDGQHYFKMINGILYRGPGDNPDEALPLGAALDSAGVAVAEFEDIRRHMTDIGIVSVSVYDGRTAFVIGGFLDDYSGLLYVPEGAAPEYGEYAPRGRIVGLTRVAPDWWLYVTT